MNMKANLFKTKMDLITLTLSILLITVSVYGQVEYIDMIPDVRISQPLEIDFNQDGITEIKFSQHYWLEGEATVTEYRVQTYDGVSVAVSSGYASAINLNSSIGTNLNWSNEATTLVMLGYVSDYEIYYGAWLDIKQGFIGIRINEGSQYMYGWIRIHQPYSWKLFVADYAIGSEGILGGDGIPLGATSIFGKDISDNFDGRDLRYSFTKAIDESIFSAYRVFIAKADDTTANNVELISQLPEEKYVQFFVDTLSPEFTEEHVMAENTIDIEGDTISMHMDYKVHVLNVAKSGVTEENILSTPSSVFSLEAYTESVQNVRGYDRGNSNSSIDINVVFDKVETEEYVSEYRIFISKKSNEDDFDVVTALNLSQSYYTSKIPDGSNINAILDSDQLDIDGDPIVNGIEYVAIVLSVADGFYSVISALAKPSRKFLLGQPDILITGQTTGDNLIHYTFDPPVITFESSYELDLNNDKTPDFTFIASSDHHWNFSAWRFHITSQRNNMVLLCENEEHGNWAAVLRASEQVGAVFRWLNEPVIIVDKEYYGYTGYSWGNWDWDWGSEEFYIGLCVMDHESPIYGWVKIVCTVAGLEWTFFECAYQISPSIVKENIDYHNVILSPNPARDYIYLNKKGDLNPNYEIYVKIYNKLGVIMDEFTFVDSDYEHCISDYPSGIYFCLIRYEGKEVEIVKFIVN